MRKLWDNYDKKILVVGLMYSGTSIVSSIIGSHSMVGMLSEVNDYWERRIIGKPVCAVKLVYPYQIRRKQLQRYIDDGYTVVFVMRNYTDWIKSWVKRIKGRALYWRIFWKLLGKLKRPIGSIMYKKYAQVVNMNPGQVKFDYDKFNKNKSKAIRDLFKDLELPKEDVLAKAERYNYAYQRIVSDLYRFCHDDIEIHGGVR